MTQDLASKTSRIFAQCTYGNPRKYFQRVNTSVRQMTPFGEFHPDPKMEVTLPESSGSLDSSIAHLTLGGNSEFSARVTDGRAFAELDIVLMELEEGWLPGFPENKITKLRYLFSGKMLSSRRHPNSKEGIIQIDVISHKAELDFALGYQANEACSFTLADFKTCKVGLSAYKETTSLVSVDGLIITANGISEIRPGIWEKGYIERDGIRISIRYRQEETSTFHVGKLIPEDWIGKDITFVPGCRKTVPDCIGWQNLAQFQGLGLNLPNRHPVFENGS